MTELASIARRTVPRVFPLGDHIIMTTEAGSDDRGVVNEGGYPVPGAMAVFAGRGR